jgi:basic membrane lipoprotein Med (substrate-binding protein (PBP1-ABC) superfamily)
MRKQLINLVLLAALMLALLPAATLAAPPSQTKGGAYTLQQAESLSDLAQKLYGDPLAYHAIVYYTDQKAAQDKTYTVIANPDLVAAGSVIYLPSDQELKDYQAGGKAGIINVGLVTDVGKVNDGTFNQYAYEGMLKAAKEFGLKNAFIETQQPTDYEKNVKQFAEEGYQMIVTVGFMMGDTTKKMGEAYPQIKFAIVDNSYDPAIPNVQGLVFREDQSGYMAGVLAGLMTKSKTVGIVAGMEIPPVKKFRNGYEHGVKYVCPDCTSLGVYIDSFTDPARGKAAAESQIAEGADVIFGAGGPTGSGGILGAAQQGVWVIGVDQDEYFTTFKGGKEKGSDKLLSSAMKRVDVAVYNAIRAADLGFFVGKTALFDAAAGGVVLAPFHDAASAIPAEVKTKLDETFKMLASGQLDTGVDPVTGDVKQ